MKIYQNLLKKIIEKGYYKEAARKGMPGTLEVFGETLKFEDVKRNFPLLTTKQVFFKGAFVELLWMLRGDTNIKYLVDNEVKIWNADAFRYYNQLFPDSNIDIDFFIKCVKEGLTEGDYTFGDCGNIYGKYFKEQLPKVIDLLKRNKNTRYASVCCWDFYSYDHIFDEKFEGKPKCALPACHSKFNININNNKLNIALDLRSSDVFLGLPFNIIFYSALILILAHEIGVEAGDLLISITSAHIYVNQINAVKEQLSREPKRPASVQLEYKDSYLDYTLEDFKVINYQHWDPIHAPLSVGI